VAWECPDLQATLTRDYYLWEERSLKQQSFLVATWPYYVYSRIPGVRRLYSKICVDKTASSLLYFRVLQLGVLRLQLSWHKHRLYYRNMAQLKQVTLAGLRYKMQLCWTGITSVSHIRTASPPYSCVLLNNVTTFLKRHLNTHLL
jgi:hypothetical protein